MDPELAERIALLVERATGEVFRPRSFEACHGGCIHQAGICRDDRRSFFIKCNEASVEPQFAAEADGLKALRAAAAVRVPEVIGHGLAGSRAVLVLEALEMGPGSAKGWRRMGEELAALHRVQGDSHGWARDNFVGTTPQSNRCHRRWASFFVEERLRPQFELACLKGMPFPGREGLLERAGGLLEDHEPAPSLLHGDLWSGNVGFLSTGQPVIFDPAVYHGDRECDLAFSEFFGGFPPEFYGAYQAAYPLSSGYPQRRDLYNLYHVLNHANLFGGGYVAQAAGMMRAITG